MLDEQRAALEVFFSYSSVYEDEILRQKLDTHLSTLKRQNYIKTWDAYAIRPGQNWKQEINAHLESADIFLLLVSADFLASDYSTSTELKRAMERHATRSAAVIPIIARPVDWTGSPFQYLQVLPRNQQPIISWPNPDEAFAQVAKEIRTIVEDFKKPSVSNAIVTGPRKNIPYERNPLFTGRDTLLQELHDAFQASNQTSATVALSGLGGMGKTQTAIEYASRYQTDYDTLLWLRADNADTLLTDFFAAAQLLELDAQRAQNQTLVLQSVKSWLQTHPRWLLIFDNADDLAVLDEVLPGQHQGHILITTQSQRTGRLARRITIDKMEPEQAVLFLLRRSALVRPDDPLTKATPNDTQLAQQIVRLLDSLPLALDQAGAYIDETHCGLDGYLDVFKSEQDYLLSHRGDRVKDHPLPVATTWSLAFKRIEDLNPAAADLLRLCAFLDPDSIPEKMIVASINVLPNSLKDLAKEPIKLNEAIRELLNYSLIRRSPDHTLSLHHLVQLVLKNEMDAETQQRWATRAVQVVSNVYPYADYKNQQLCLEYLPHAQYCAQLIKQWNISSSEGTELLTEAGSYLEIAGQYKQAEPLFEQALHIREATLDADDPDIAISLNNLGGVYQAQGRYEEGELLFKQALDFNEKILGTNHYSTAMSLNNLAHLYQAQGRYEEAELLFKQALDIYKKVPEVNHPDAAASLNNLANLYRDQGRYEEAEPLHKQSLAIKEETLGADHPETAASLNNLANLYRIQGRYAKAEPLFERALDIYERVLGTDHPSMATGLNNLAHLYQAQGRYKDAEPLYKRALNTYEKVFDTNHPDTAASLNNLANLYQAQGRYKDAEPLYKRALAVKEKTLGATHPSTGTTMSNLAYLYRDQGRYEEAEPLYKRALAVKEKTLGATHPSTGTTMSNLAYLYRDQKRYEEAEPLFEQALKIYEKVLGADHPDTATALNNLASLYYAQGRYKEAEPLYERSLAIYDQMFGSDSFKFAVSLDNLAVLYQAQERYQEAEQLYKRSLAVSKNVFGAEHPNTAITLYNFAGLYKVQKRYEEAEKLYKQTLDIYKDNLGPEHSYTIATKNNMEKLYQE